MRSIVKRSALTLLHIDGHGHDRLLLQAANRSTGTHFECRGVDSIQAAIDYFAFLPQMIRPAVHPRPSLVLLDYELGSQRGTDFLYWLRIQHRNTAIPIIMYSGAVTDEQVAECYALGANHYLRKPYSSIRTIALMSTLHNCFSLRIANFQFLARLPESRPDPRLNTPTLTGAQTCGPALVNR